MANLKCVACGDRDKYVKVEPRSVFVEGYPSLGRWGFYPGGSPLCQIHPRHEATGEDLKGVYG